MAIDKESVFHTGGGESAEEEKKSSKKKKRVSARVVLPEVVTRPEDKPETKEKTESKKKRQKKAAKAEKGAEPEQAKDESIEAPVAELTATETETTSAEATVDLRDGSVEVDLHGGEVEIMLHGTDAQAVHEEVPEDAATPAATAEEPVAPAVRSSRRRAVAAGTASVEPTPPSSTTASPEASVAATATTEATAPAITVVPPPERVERAAYDVSSAVEHNTTAPSTSRTEHSGGDFIAGAVVGGAVGATVEHVRHKSREKKLTKAQATLAEDLRETKEQVARVQTEAVNDRQELDRTVKEQREQKQESARAKTTLEERLERLRNQQRAENDGAALQKAKKATPEVVVKEEQPTVAPDRRVESSAWHRIEIDKKTGKPVENPTTPYGEEFMHEQHQEQLRKQVLEESMDSDRVREAYQSLTTAQKPQTPSPQPAAPLGGDTLPSPQATGTAPVSAPQRPTPPKKRTQLPDLSVIDIALAVILAVVVIAILAVL